MKGMDILDLEKQCLDVVFWHEGTHQSYFRLPVERILDSMTWGLNWPAKLRPLAGRKRSLGAHVERSRGAHPAPTAARPGRRRPSISARIRRLGSLRAQLREMQ